MRHRGVCVVKKIPKSITVTVRREIRNGWHRLFAYLGDEEFDGMGQGILDIRKVRKNTPYPPYKVTYSVRKTGAKVTTDGPHPIVVWSGQHGYIHACFLPNSWGGKRVSRKVTKI